VRNVGASRLGVEKSDDAVGIVKIRQTRSGLVNEAYVHTRLHARFPTSPGIRDRFHVTIANIETDTSPVA
jgi:hypothetical protein